MLKIVRSFLLATNMLQSWLCLIIIKNSLYRVLFKKFIHDLSALSLQMPIGLEKGMWISIFTVGMLNNSVQL